MAKRDPDIPDDFEYVTLDNVSYGPEKIPPSEIHELAKRNPFVYRAYNFWLEGHVTWEQAMALAVKWLVEENDRIRRVAGNIRVVQTIKEINSNGKVHRTVEDRIVYRDGKEVHRERIP